MKKENPPSPWRFLIPPLIAVVGSGVIYFLASKIPPEWAAFAITLLVWAVVGGVVFGFWMGKVEVKGILQGLDIGMDKFFSFKEQHQRTREVPPVVLVPPQYPQINHRVGGGDDGWKEY